MSLIELERRFDYPNSIKKVYLKPNNKKEFLSGQSSIDEFGRQESYKTYSENGEIKDKGTIRFPTKSIEITEIISSSGDRDEISKEYNPNNNLVYESFQFGWDGTKDETFLKYNENGTLHSISDVENIFKKEYSDKGYHFEYNGHDINRVYTKHGNELITIIKVNTKGKEKEVIFFEGSEIDRKLIFKLDDNNRVIEEVNIRFDDYASNEIMSNCKTVYEYNPNGTIKKELWIDYDVENNEIINTEESQFDENGYKIKRIVQDENPNNNFCERIIYNKKEANR